MGGWVRETSGVSSPDTRPCAALFDIDGTLVDSNYAHVAAWTRAFTDVDHPIDAWRIHRAIGMDSSMLLRELLGDDADALGDRVKDLHQTYYAEAAGQLHVFDGARELLRMLHDRGVRVVLATSAPEDELARLRDLLQVEDLIHAITSSEDVETAKPDPQVLDIALDKAGVDAGRAVMIGDAVWDARSSVKAGIAFVGVLTGGISADELRDAGAGEVWTDVAELGRHLEDSVVDRLLG